MLTLELRLAERRGVGSDQDQLGLAAAERLEGSLVAQRDLSGLDDEGQTLTEGVAGLVLAVAGHLGCGCRVVGLSKVTLVRW